MSTIAIFGFGLLFGYLSCLHGSDMQQNDLIAFAAWSAAAILLGYLVTWFFKYVFVLAVLLIGALWWTQSPLFSQTASDARDLRAAICSLITVDVPDAPVKEWIC